MNEYQVNLYNALMELAESSEAFYFADTRLQDTEYRIFNYRMTSYTEFLQPCALECRGTMYAMKDGEPTALASLAFEKFFNLNENPMTMNLDLTTVKEIADKADGSLITSYTNTDDSLANTQPAISASNIYFKSKGSVTSEQAMAATGWMNLPENEQYLKEIVGAERLGYTVQFEWCAPDNRIVLGYENPELRVLGIRSRIDGSYVHFEDVDIYVFPKIVEHWTKLETVEDPASFVASIPGMVNIEGYVLRLESGQRVKVKTSWYLALHHMKDSINSPRRLFEAVLEEATDDMRSLFFEDKMAIQLIDDMEVFVREKYNHMVDQVERFYERNKHLDRKDYAILGQQELDRMYFGLAMNKYTEREFDYKDFLKGKWKELGLKDIQKEDETGTTLVSDLEAIPPIVGVVQ